MVVRTDPLEFRNFSNVIFSETQFRSLLNICYYGIHPTSSRFMKMSEKQNNEKQVKQKE